MPPAASQDRAAESLLAFWTEAGVDAMLLDAPRDRLAEGLAARAAPAAPAPAVFRAPAAAPAPGVDIAGPLAQAQELAAAAPDLEALAAAIAAFDGCGLKFEGAATRAVFSRGPADAPLMVIGEGPGADEDALGEPFVGAAGKFLNEMLAMIDLKREDVYITNIVKYRPPNDSTTVGTAARY